MSKPTTFEIAPLSPTLGARISGVDLAGPLHDETIAEIRKALLQHEVLFFEDQTLTPPQHRDLAARFGQLHLHPIRPSVPGSPEVLVMDNQPASDTDTGAWRADVTFIDTPPMASMLYAREVPAEGGDTLWSSMRAAYAALSPSLRAFLQPLDAEHDFTRSFPPDHLASLNVGIERYAWARREYPPVAHPLVRTHPETGREGLFVNSGFTTRILGLTKAESAKILELLSEHIQRPEFVVRWRWRPNTLAFWDNRVTQHYTVDDYQPHRRVMHRVTILGDKPFNRTRMRLAAE
ncbi:MAG: taurine dioxygenase [Alphaproteobacteria bacterium]|uniref:taurine dioxygenase n=1 Tax=Bradyrhizobium sp. TaxID=376 RepID=UPI001EBB18B8|nr:taurine dioxygenase [Bradyrhizobium sp.]MBV9570796.1 taurine dioxygenase [Alphaproteobacteria bacterium]MBV9979047.1 taurine dioxygenase [Bradyrhizobium sp.]